MEKNIFPQRRVRITANEIHRTTFFEKKREPIPFHLYLEEQRKKVVKKEVESQCDEFQDRSSELPYIPQKKGYDVGSQVDTTKIFHFEREIKPLVNVVVSKTLEQSLMEVTQEEVLKQLELEKKQFRAKRKEEQKFLNQQKEKEINRIKEKNERKKKARIKKLRIKKLLQKTEVWNDLGEITNSLNRNCVNHLKYLTLHLSKDQLIIKEKVIPDIYANVLKKVNNCKISHELVDDIIRNVCEVKISHRIKLAMLEMKKLRLCIHLEHGEELRIALEKDAVVSEIRSAVFDYLVSSQLREKNYDIETIKVFTNNEPLKLTEKVANLTNRNITVRIQQPTDDETHEDQNVEDQNSEEKET